MIKNLLQQEIFLYLFFGVAATIVYILTRTVLFSIINHTLTVVFLANCVAILFAFVTNDRFVFRQKAQGWLPRLVKFISARISTLVLDMVLAWLLVDTFPQIIGQFVGQNRQQINTIATLFSQVLVIALNYLLSKLFIFKEKETD